MKKIALSLLMASVIVLGSEEGTSDSTTYIINQSTVNDVVNSTNRVDFATSKERFSAGVELVYTENVTIVNIPLSANIGSHYGVEANIPVVKATDPFTGDENTGLGDISVGGNYHFGKPSQKFGNNITTFIYKTTTADEKKGLGAQEPAYTLSHRITKDITHTFQGNALVSYTINDEKDAGNAYMLMVGGSRPCMLNSNIRTNVKLTYFHSDSHDWFGFDVGEVNSADFWIGWNSKKIIKDVPLGFGIKIPLMNEVDGKSKDETMLFYLSASNFF